MSNNTSVPAFRRLDAQARRRQLLDTGARLFATQPYGEVWIDNVAAAAGISRGLLYHYFGSKRGFFAAVIEHEAAALMRAVEPDPDLPPLRRFRVALDAYLDYVQAHPQGWRAIHQGTVGTDSAIRAIVERNLAQQEQRILDGLPGDQQAPEVVRLAVRGWLAFLIAVCLDWLDRPGLDRATVHRLCVETLAGALAAAGHHLPAT